MALLKFGVKYLYNLLQRKWDFKSINSRGGTARKIRERTREEREAEKEGELKEREERRRLRRGADEEEERERDEEMRGRAADFGISRKVSAVSRRPLLGTNRFLDEARRRNCESIRRSSEKHALGLF